jgi:hypothetical protein
MKPKRKYKFKGNKPFVDRDGYRYIPLDDAVDPLYHPMFTKRFTPEHRYVVAQSLKRALNSREHVHHKDSNRMNNVLENLELIDAAAHLKEHIRKGNFKLFSKDYQPLRRKNIN